MSHIKVPTSSMTLSKALALTLFVKIAIGSSGWSGKGVSPTFGDFEAQRHWMELTLHLSTSEWYTYSPDYWRLDYPPLSAWVSLWFAKIAQLHSPLRPCFALSDSRGSESFLLAAFMRLSVHVTDYLIFIPAVLMFLASRRSDNSTKRQTVISASSIILQPAMNLIDHGHFQYNCVMLGLCTATYALLSGIPSTKRYMLAAICFSLALCFKQMALFYAPAVFAHMLGFCFQIGRKDVYGGIQALICIGLATVTTFAIVFYPWIGSFDQLSIIARRCFPIARGLFEDKVSNIWCLLSHLPFIAKTYKLRTLFAAETLASLSLFTTLLAIIPPCIIHFISVMKETKASPRKSDTIFPYTLTAISMAFFLFGFQVHEKSILLPLLPLTLFMDVFTQVELDIALLANNVATFSLWPLLKRDGVALQYFGILILWNTLFKGQRWKSILTECWRKQQVRHIIFMLIHAAMLGLHLLELFFFLAPTYSRCVLQRYPDLLAVLNIYLCTPIFIAIWIWSLWKQMDLFRRREIDFEDGSCHKCYQLGQQYENEKSQS